VSALPGRASLRQEDVWKRRYLVSGDGHLRTVGTGSRRPSRSIRSPPAGGAPRGDDNQRRGCTEVPIPFGGEEPTRNQGRPGRAADPSSSFSPRGVRDGQVEPGPINSAVLRDGRAGRTRHRSLLAAGLPVVGVPADVGRRDPSGWRWSVWVEQLLAFFLVILRSVIFGCGCSLGSSKAFEPRLAAGDRQPRSSRWVSRPSGAVAYPRRVPRRSRLVLAEWCCLRVFAQRAWTHLGGAATTASKTRRRITA